MSRKWRSRPSKDSSTRFLYHHCRPASGSTSGTITADRFLSDPDFLPSYDWVEEQLGFFPLFLAAGTLDTIAWMTGYQDNWRVWTGGIFVEGRYRKIYRQKGEFPNLALLSFDTVEGVFMDYDYWHIVLSACMNGTTVTQQEKVWIFKPSWGKSRWLHAALTGTHHVQIVAPELPLWLSGKIRVRNRATVCRLKERGFENVQVFEDSCTPEPATH